jgi:hypothetical protein
MQGGGFMMLLGMLILVIAVYLLLGPVEHDRKWILGVLGGALILVSAYNLAIAWFYSRIAFYPGYFLSCSPGGVVSSVIGLIAGLALIFTVRSGRKSKTGDQPGEQ